MSQPWEEPWGARWEEEKGNQSVASVLGGREGSLYVPWLPRDSLHRQLCGLKGLWL